LPVSENRRRKALKTELDQLLYVTKRKEILLASQRRKHPVKFKIFYELTVFYLESLLIYDFGTLIIVSLLLKFQKRTDSDDYFYRFLIFVVGV